MGVRGTEVVRISHGKSAGTDMSLLHWNEEDKQNEDWWKRFGEYAT